MSHNANLTNDSKQTFIWSIGLLATYLLERNTNDHLSPCLTPVTLPNLPTHTCTCKYKRRQSSLINWQYIVLKKCLLTSQWSVLLLLCCCVIWWLVLLHSLVMVSVLYLSSVVYVCLSLDVKLAANGIPLTNYGRINQIASGDTLECQGYGNTGSWTSGPHNL